MKIKYWLNGLNTGLELELCSGLIAYGLEFNPKDGPETGGTQNSGGSHQNFDPR